LNALRNLLTECHKKQQKREATGGPPYLFCFSPNQSFSVSGTYWARDRMNEIQHRMIIPNAQDDVVVLNDKLKVRNEARLRRGDRMEKLSATCTQLLQDRRFLFGRH